MGQETSCLFCEKVIKDCWFIFTFVKFLPVLLAIGETSVLPEVLDEEVAALEGVLKRQKDRKEAQIIANYDRVYAIIDSAIEKYSLERPLLFQTETERRTSLTFFNTNEEVYLIFLWLSTGNKRIHLRKSKE